MTISDASEIQFWPTGTESFNTKQEAYMEDACFHQKFLCSGLRSLQVLGGADENQDLRLSILEDGVEVETLDFTQTNNEIPGTPGIPAIPGVTSAIILPALSSGINISIGGADWVTGSNPSVSITGTGTVISDVWSNNYNFIPGYTYNINFQIDCSFSGGLSVNKIYFTVYDIGNANLYSQIFSAFGSSVSGMASFVATSGGVKFGFRIDKTGGASATFNADIVLITATQTTPVTPAVPAGPVTPATYYLNSIAFSPYDYSLCDKFLSFKIYNKDSLPDEELFYSDKVEFVSSWINSSVSGRVVIKFKSAINFAALIYDDDSDFFSIEIDGQFVEGEFQTTEKVLELTEMVLNTASTFKEKTNLVINDAPRYMHRKIILALQHSISGQCMVNGIPISLDGGSYTLTKRNQHYILKPAEILLTHKNSYIHNVI